MVGLSERYLSDPDMVAAQIVEQEYLQALGKYSLFFGGPWVFVHLTNLKQSYRGLKYLINIL